MTRTPPSWFQRIHETTWARWDLLERDEGLRGPWTQLFRQVQSHEHVISELIQNAEDAGSTRVEIDLFGDEFVFRHDGHDFTEEEFDSLCQFGLSNKRNVWSIGFRGMGFKSLFSLGSTVVLRTPTLAVRFEKQRFTHPLWEDDAPPCRDTEIRARIETPELLDAMKQQLKQWASEPLPLLFLECVRQLSVVGLERTAKPTEAGPLPHAQRFSIEGSRLGTVLRIPLQLGELPDEALKEIRAERGASEGLELPPIRAVAVLGPSVPHRFFAVLPTRTSHAFPVAIHAPFLLDPARTGLKHPAQSPTNRWILKRVGEGLAAALLGWLCNRELPLEERAHAYQLLPTATSLDKAADDPFTRELLAGFEPVLKGQALALAADGSLLDAAEIAALPAEVIAAWGPETARRLFAPGGKAVLAPEALPYVRVLERWAGVRPVDDRRILDRLEADDEPPEIPRPQSFEALAGLWKWCDKTLREVYSGDLQEDRRDRLWRQARLLPLRGSPRLGRREQTVVLPAHHPDGIAGEEWELLAALVDSVDPDWLDWMGRRQEQDPPLKAIFRRLSLERGDRVAEIWKTAILPVFEEKSPDPEIAGRLLMSRPAFHANQGPTGRPAGRPSHLLRGILHLAGGTPRRTAPVPPAVPPRACGQGRSLFRAPREAVDRTLE